MRRSIRTVATVVVLLATLGAPVVGPVAAQSSDSAAADGGEKRCFPPGGHELSVGTEGPGIGMTVHTSLFSNLGGEGALGLEARGTALNATIVSLRTGVVFNGVGDAGAFLSNPFSRFAIVYDYSFDLPMFSSLGGDRSSYASEESPVSGVETRAC
ncbi:DUF7332 family protein [Halopelagius fulvigenes]|uniref:Uncharacterized protein n=1 Tax=Halopelagius fulvigenes TaxID=1198324 RepID=A0ABD5U021_9EURY